MPKQKQKLGNDHLHGQQNMMIIEAEAVFMVGSVSEGTDFGQKKNLNQQVYWFMV